MDLDKRIDEESEPLLQRLRDRLPDLEELLDEVNGHWQFPDGFYRFYHQSWKVFGLQRSTEQIVSLLRTFNPEGDLNPWFQQIITEGTGHEFTMKSNENWLAETRPILEAFFHARAMLELAIQAARELDHAPCMMPSGWAALLYLYNARYSSPLTTPNRQPPNPEPFTLD